MPYRGLHNSILICLSQKGLSPSSKEVSGSNPASIGFLPLTPLKATCPASCVLPGTNGQHVLVGSHEFIGFSRLLKRKRGSLGNRSKRVRGRAFYFLIQDETCWVGFLSRLLVRSYLLVNIPRVYQFIVIKLVSIPKVIRFCNLPYLKGLWFNEETRKFSW